jgi:hypothetical protein
VVRGVGVGDDLPQDGVVRAEGPAPGRAESQVSAAATAGAGLAHGHVADLFQGGDLLWTGPSHSGSGCPARRRSRPSRPRSARATIESLNARFRRSVKARGHFPTEQAALKHLYLVIISLDPTGRGRQRWSNLWKAALNAFDITFDGRLSAGRK